jgi:KDO2-lipid IV(A) lauroyltransferase
MHTLMLWLSRRGLGFLHFWGGVLGWLIWALSPTYRGRLAANAALAGVSRSAQRQAVAEAGRLVMELPWLWLRPADALLGDKARWDHPERIDAALAPGKGVILLTPHMGCFEGMAQLYAETHGRTHGPVTVLYRPARQRWLRDMMVTGRRRPGMDAAPATLAGVRQMIRALRRGEAVGLLPDQVPADGLGVWAPFFGRPAYTMTLATRLAQQTGATVLLLWAERLPRGAGWLMHVSPLSEPLPESDPGQVAGAALINREMARLIGEQPGQYLWGYDRYKQPKPLAAAGVAGPDAA